MNFNYELSDKIINFITGAEIEKINIGCSNSQVFKIKKDNKIYFIKMASLGLLTNEYKALKWLENKLIVPKIVMYDVYNGSEFLITEKVNGEMACSEDMVKNYDIGIKVIVDAFKNLYNVDYSTCPFNVSLDYKLNLVSENVKKGLINYDDLSDDIKLQFKSLNEILKYLYDNKFEEELCFSHGDTSLPNIFCKDGCASSVLNI